MTEERRAQLQSLSIERGPESGGTRSGVPVRTVAVAVILVAVAASTATWYAVGPGGSTQGVGATAEAAEVIPGGTEQDPAEGGVPAAGPGASGLVASGYVTARRQATVSAEITGRISEVRVEEGTVVRAGEVLARLDDERAQLDLEQIDAQIAVASARVRSLEAQAVEADVVLRRAENLLERGLETDAAVTAARAQESNLAAQLRAAQAEFASAEVRRSSQLDLIERHVVRAPFAGVVVAKNAQVGEILSPASAGGGFTRTGIATLVDMASLEIEVDVNEGQIQRVKPGQPVEAILDSYPGWRIPASVEAIIPTADRSRATIRVRVAFLERDERVLPDMAARVTFIEQ